MSGKVFVTRRLPPLCMEKLENAPEITELKVNPHDRPMTRAELEEAVKWADGLLAQLVDTIDGDLLDLNPDLKIVANYAVGYNNINVAACTARGIPASNTPGVLTETTADLTWALLMDAARRISEGDRYMRAGKYKAWAPQLLLGQDVFGKTIGIVGLGRIGMAVARRAKGFNMKVLYNDIHEMEHAKEVDGKFVDLDILLKESDYISLHPFLDEKTTHMIDERELKMMKDTAILVNASRGPVINENMLVKALKEGWIAGAALDVYEREPEMEEGLAELDNAVLAPHLGSASIETRTAMGIMAADNIIAVLKGEKAPTCLNPEVL